MNKFVRSLYRAAAVVILLGIALPASADLTHRYSFTTNANDSIGTAHGAAVATPNGTVPTFAGGKVQLDGLGGYVDLPNNLFSTLTNVTIEAWVTADVASNWSRIFDFGNTTVGERTAADTGGANGLNYMFLTPNGAGSGRARFTITDGTNGAERPVLNDAEPFPVGEEVYVALSYGGGVTRLYINGREAASGPVQVQLSALVDVNNWLGRSLYQADPMFAGSYNEFRIHNSVVGGPEIKASAKGGADTVTYDPGTVSALSLQVDSPILVGQTASQQIKATFSIIGDADLSGTDVTLTSSATNIVRVTSAGTLEGAGVGSATITASRGGKSATASVVVNPAAAAVLKNRWSFSDAPGSTTVKDSVGGKDGEIRPPFGDTTSLVLTNGQVLFPAAGATNYQTSGYVNLPDGIISSKTNVTIETWITWNGPNAGAQNWARIFDFGDSSKGDDAQLPGSGAGRGYLFLSPRAGGNTLRFAAEPVAGGENPVLNVSPTISINQEHLITVVYAPTFQTSRMYVDGALVASGGAPFALTQLSDVNNWLGQSQYGDAAYSGFINELRIYEGFLTDLEVTLNKNAGPNTLAPAPGPLQSLALNAIPSLLLSNNTTTASALIANFQNTTNVNVTTVAGSGFSSSNTNIFNVSATGAVLPRSAGTASLIGSYSGLSSTTTVTVLPPTALRHEITTNTLVAGAPLVTATLRADFATQTNVNVSGFNGVSRTSSNPTVLTIAANGAMTAVTAGKATITSSYGGLTTSTEITVVFPAAYKAGTLVHRYNFDGARDTTAVRDSIGTAHGELVGMQAGSTNNNFLGTGQVALGGSLWNADLTGGTLGAYVNLPNGLVSTLTSVTLEGWANVRATTANMRFFDFGISTDAAGTNFVEDVIGVRGSSYMFLTPSGPRFAINRGTAGESPSITSSTAITLNTNQHYAVVYDQPNGVARLYINGRRVGTGAATQPLNTVDDRDAWLGRSVWQDPLLNGIYDEFRIYNGPLSDSDVAASFAAGPNTLITPGTNEPPTSTKGNIVFVSFHPGDNTPSAAAATAGFTKAPDIGYTDLLKANGYNVTRFQSVDNAVLTSLSSADLVIISRSVASGHYQDPPETLAWNGLNKPVIILGGYILRNSRLGYTTGATIPDSTGTVRLTVKNPSHPVFAGVTLGVSNVMANAYANIATYTNAPQLGISVNTDAVAGGGTVLAVNAAVGGANGGMIIGEWQAGAKLGNAAGDVLGGHRLVLLTGSRENNGLTSEGAGIYDLDTDGAKLFLNAVAYMIAPPTTGPKFTSSTITSGNLKIEWTGGGTLESAANVTGPWATVAGAASPYTTPATAAGQFYRVRQ